MHACSASATLAFIYGQASTAAAAPRQARFPQRHRRSEARTRRRDVVRWHGRVGIELSSVLCSVWVVAAPMCRTYPATPRHAAHLQPEQWRTGTAPCSARCAQAAAVATACLLFRVYPAAPPPVRCCSVSTQRTVARPRSGRSPRTVHARIRSFCSCTPSDLAAF